MPPNTPANTRPFWHNLINSSKDKYWCQTFATSTTTAINGHNTAVKGRPATTTVSQWTILVLVLHVVLVPVPAVSFVVIVLHVVPVPVLVLVQHVVLVSVPVSVLVIVLPVVSVPVLVLILHVVISLSPSLIPSHRRTCSPGPSPNPSPTRSISLSPNLSPIHRPTCSLSPSPSLSHRPHTCSRSCRRQINRRTLRVQRLRRGRRCSGTARSDATRALSLRAVSQHNTSTLTILYFIERYHFQ